MIQGIITSILLFSFLAIIFWAFSKTKKKDFDEAANLPFDDEQMHKRSSVQNQRGDK